MMELKAGSVSNEPREIAQSASDSAHLFSSSALQVGVSPKSPISSRSPKTFGKHGTTVASQSRGSPSKGSPSAGSPKKGSPSAGSPIKGSPSAAFPTKGSPFKNNRQSHCSIDGRPKKGGGGGKGTWGTLLDTEDRYSHDPNDPNYDSNEDHEQRNLRGVDFDQYKKKATIIVEEYFATDDALSTASELKELAMPNFHFYFVKKLVSMAMDRHDKEKEMAALLLSTLYADVIDPIQVQKGFSTLVECADDLFVDIPDAVDVLAVFVARAVVDDILPPAFLMKQMGLISDGSKGAEVLKRAEKSYLAAPLHAEIIERRWGGSKNRTVEDLKGRINNLLIEYVASGDKKEAFRCIKDLKVPFFHHEIVKRALIMAMERHRAEGKLLDLLKEAVEEGLINSSQITKGFSRIIETVDDLSLDVPNARKLLQSLITKAASEGWLCASALKSLSLEPEKRTLEDSAAKTFKIKAQTIIQEYFLSSDISEVIRCLKSENSTSSSELHPIFVKRLITLAMDRKNREKEMASVLLSSLYFLADDVLNGFIMLIDSADDIALDNPVVVEDLAKFLSRAVVDEVLAPQNLEEIGSRFSEQESVIGCEVIKMTKSLLKARLSGERILRCWGGSGGSSMPGWDFEDVKDKIRKLMEEYESGGDVREACRCIKELGMPFFHHEIVKKAMVIVVEKKSVLLWGLLRECFDSGLITTYQMTKGFERVAESLDDLALDVPDARKQFIHHIERAKKAGWLDSSFTFEQIKENGTYPGQ